MNSILKCYLIYTWVAVIFFFYMDKWILIEVKEMPYLSTLIELYNIIKKCINDLLLYKRNDYKLIEMVVIIYHFLFYNYLSNQDYFTQKQK